MDRKTTDIIRLISILAVLIIHITTPWEYSLIKSHNYLSEDLLGVLLNQFGRFCVPIFILLSGYSLAKKYGKDWENKKIGAAELKEFISNRASKIVLPFLVWSFVFLLAKGRFVFSGMGFVDALLTNVKTYFSSIIRGDSEYHFYFFVIIIQCYILFPLLFRFAKIPLLLLFLFIQLLLTYPAGNLWSMAGLAQPVFNSAFCIYFVFYFFLGIIAAKKENILIERLGRIKSGWFVGLLVFIGSLVTAEYIMNTYRFDNPGYINHFNRHVVILYAVAFFFFMLRFAPKFRAYFEKPGRKDGFFVRMSALSFPVYIFHTAILYSVISLIGNPELFLMIGLVVGLSFLLAFIMNKVIKIKWLRTIFGL